MTELALTPTLLLILDGWGIAPAGASNATSVAKTINMDTLNAFAPHSSLEASGLAVGLPEGYIGNSEVGHLNIGAGSVVYQDMTRIDLAMESGELGTNAVFADLMEKTLAGSKRLHLAGLLSDGGVHSHYKHMLTLVDAAVKAGLEVFIHCFMDGRDTTPRGGLEYVRKVEEALAPYAGKARIASLCGRFYIMDRDTRWERVEKAWNMLVHGKNSAGPINPEHEAAGSSQAVSATYTMLASYAAEIFDEFIEPTLLVENAHWQNGDGLFLWNFRADRMRELVQALTMPGFEGFERGVTPAFAGIATMTSYDASFTLPVAFPKENLTMGLGEVVSSWGCSQLRIAETEKYAHVTYFFNGGRETPFPGEDRILIPSPRHVPTYDLAPTMSCYEVTERCIEAMKSGKYTLIVCNLANGDMVGHTGKMDAAIQACETVDACLGQFMQAICDIQGRMLVIADHGNCETMADENGAPQTSHTTNPVPCILFEGTEEKSPGHLQHGKLADVAPTLIKLWNKDIPASMSGTALMEPCNEKR